MATGMVTTWGGTITDIGPIYPFVGNESLMVIIGVVFWLVWHILQTRAETREYMEDMRRLKDKDTAKRVLDREG